MKSIALLLVTVLVAACTAPPARHAPGTLPAVDATDHWHLFGRIALTRGESGWHAGVDWQETPGLFRLRVKGPFGQGGVELTGSGDQVVLRDAEGGLHAAESLDALLLRVTGWELPVEGLRYWTRGLPAPASRAVTGYDEAGRLVQLQQDGWTIDYARYHDPVGGQWPAKLRLVRDDVSVRLVIDRWQLGKPAVSLP